MGNDDESCTTPRSERGSCINIKNCSSAIALLKSSSSVDLGYLRSLQCKSDKLGTPKVCCVDLIATRIEVNSEPANVSKIEVDTEPPNVSNHPNLEKINQNCGSIVTDKIVGGQKTSINEYPWMVLISYKIGKH